MNICILIGTFRPDVACRVMTENIALIKSAKVDLQFLADKLLEKEIIDASEREAVTNELSGRTADQRMDKLLEIFTASIRLDGEDFGLFIEIIKQLNTRRAERLAQTLLDTYKRLSSSDHQPNDGKKAKFVKFYKLLFL